MTVRTTFVLVAVAALAFGAWRMLLAPQAEKATNGAGDSAGALIDTMSRAYFTGAEASLEVQRSTTGSYAGARLEPPMTLVRADATSYCIQLDRPSMQAHENGPGGAPAAGHCG
jgi:hypothetical protein